MPYTHWTASSLLSWITLRHLWSLVFIFILSSNNTNAYISQNSTCYLLGLSSLPLSLTHWSKEEVLFAHHQNCLAQFVIPKSHPTMYMLFRGLISIITIHSISCTIAEWSGTMMTLGNYSASATVCKMSTIVTLRLVYLAIINW